jgi:two-component system, OmpR family, sensor histidine kinase MprB
MSFRRRLVLLTTAAVALAVVVSSVVVYVVVRNELRSQVDSQLRAFAGGVFVAGVADAKLPRGAAPPADRFQVRVKRTERGVVGKRVGSRVVVPRDPLGGPGGYAEFVTASGHAVLPGRPRLPIPRPVMARVRRIAAGKSDAFLGDAVVNGVPVRVYSRPVAKGTAVVAVRSLKQVDDTLSRLAWTLLAVSIGGIVVAVALGLLVVRRGLKPLRGLNAAVEHVAETQDLTRRIPAAGNDELRQLADSFNGMLAALDRSRTAQRQLVADASHELRTPLTSLRTNIEVLQRPEGLSAGDRTRLLRDVREQLADLGVLVGDLVDLAREEEQEIEHQPFQLDELAAEAVERARLHAPGQDFDVDLQPCVVAADPFRVERALANLLDNAVKWNPPGTAVEVRVRDGVVTVRDHGPGIDPEDVPHVFDRFYRAAGARGLPGSGLGLAIVRQVADEHGGSVRVRTPPGGGAQLRLELPVAADGAAAFAR